VESLKKDFVNQISENQRLIHKVCNVYCYTSEDRKDLFQDIVLQLWRAYPSFKGAAKFSTWLYRIALNTAISQIRKQKMKLVGLSALASDNLLADDTQGKIEKQQLLNSLIGTLNNIDKSIILLYLEEKSYEEIALIMGMSQSSISVRLVRIKRKLEKTFKQHA